MFLYLFFLWKTYVQHKTLHLWAGKFKFAVTWGFLLFRSTFFDLEQTLKTGWVVSYWIYARKRQFHQSYKTLQNLSPSPSVPIQAKTLSVNEVICRFKKLNPCGVKRNNSMPGFTKYSLTMAQLGAKWVGEFTQWKRSIANSLIVTSHGLTCQRSFKVEAFQILDFCGT